jgi:single-strand DNA-binding protein
MLPAIVLNGNVVADPELRFTPSGKAVARFRVACNNRIRKGSEWVDGEACFLDVQMWEGKAESLVEHVNKGTAVLVTGRLQQRSYETKEGEKRTVYEVAADEVAVVVKPAAKARAGGDPWAAGAQWGPQDEQPPF